MQGDDDREPPEDRQRGADRSQPGQDEPDQDSPAPDRHAPERSPDQHQSSGASIRERDRDDSPPRQSAPSQRGPNGSSAGGSSNGSNWKLYAFDLVSSAAIVVVIGGLLFTASGIWPPMVAVESGSMEPVLERGDLVYVMEGDRFPGAGAHDETGVVTYRAGQETGYEQFGTYGDVIVFNPDGNTQATPIIHRAMFWVDDGENWLNKANPRYYRGSVCEEGNGGDKVPHCPAPHAGFITKGDNNGEYDQVTNVAGQTGPIKPEWVVGTAEIAVPHLGNIRLGASGGSRADSSTNETAS